MKEVSSCGDVYKKPLFFSLITIVILLAGFSEAIAYDKYSDCDDCHGDFRDSPYVSLANGANWGDSLHDVHREKMLNDDCNACHVSGDFDSVSIDSSDGGNGLAPISCMGCHGRDEDMGNDSVSGGRGAGLRQHHYTAGVEGCVNCHSDSNPASYTPAGEDVLPDYYANPGMNHPQIPMDPCNADGGERFAGTEGLDNDGDGSYDAADSDCMVMSTTYSVGGTVSGLSGSGLALQNNGADTLSIAANGSFTFAAELEDASAYSVTVSTQPSGQTCSVANGSGTIATADVNNVAVTCQDNPSPGVQINTGMNDAWFYPETDGQGMLISVFDDSNVMFVAWFTFDVERPPEDVSAMLGDPGHRWLTAQGTFNGNIATLELYQTVGGVFDSSNPAPDPAEKIGTMTIVWSSCNSAIVSYVIDSPSLVGEFPIQRVVPNNIKLCESMQ